MAAWAGKIEEANATTKQMLAIDTRIKRIEEWLNRMSGYFVDERGLSGVLP